MVLLIHEMPLMDQVRANYRLFYCLWYFQFYPDSPETAKREIGIFFPEFNYEAWFKTEEPKFHHNLKLDKTNFIHVTNNG